MRSGVFQLAEHRLELLLAGVVSLAAAGMATAAASPAPAPEPSLLPPATAVGVHTDTLFVGGYARGSFTEAIHTLAADIPREEQALLGQHLDRVFAGVLDSAGLGTTGRLRVAYERTTRPDGTARSLRVLTAEAAVAGELHTAYFFERDGQPGYYDPFGRSLEEEPWSSPLQTLRVSSHFGRRRLHPILNRVLPHTGTDYAATTGTPVFSTADGIVSSAGLRGGYGKMIEIQHPSGYTTRYAHLSAIIPTVAPGTPVRQGTLIGRVGMTGMATGPHLHYEVRRNGVPIDPARLAFDRTVARELSDDGWAAERNRLSRLLARTPTLQRIAGDPERATFRASVAHR